VPTRRNFLGWFTDTLCGLLAYTLSRWIWKRQGGGVFDDLFAELCTFAAFFVLLKLAFKGIGLARKKKPSA
jgi:hypothetical protein